MVGRFRQLYLSAVATLVDKLIVTGTWILSFTNTGMTRRLRVVFAGIPNETIAASSDSGPFDPMTDGKINIHPDTKNPTRAWEKLKVKQTVTKVKPMPRDTEIYPNKVRFVCISDTHNRQIPLEIIPNGDVLIHGGDFSMVGNPSQIEEFNTFLGKLPHKHKIVIAGNHDLSFDPAFLKGGQLRRFGMKAEDIIEYMSSRNIGRMADVLTNCTAYLEDEEATVCGIKIYGSPWQPWFGDWGFNLERGADCLEKWNMIPEGVDVLITHGPPLGHGDYCTSDERAGCVELLHTIQHRVKPKCHIFGHIHEGYGTTTDGVTKYINASTCTYRYKGTNPAIIFDLPLPEGCSKDDILLPTRATDHEEGHMDSNDTSAPTASPK